MAQFIDTYKQKGITFPIVLSSGKVVVDSYEKLISQSILTILYWPITSMPFNPSFGSRISQLIGEQNSTLLRVLVKTFLLDALSRYEPRVSILDLTISIPTVSSMHIIVRYKILATSLEADLEITHVI